MKDFDTKWQALARQARQAAPRDEAAPLGFATRVLAHSRAETQPPREEVWGRMALRLLGVAIPVLILCAVLEAPHLRSSPSLESGVENTVAQIVWRL